MIEHYLEKFLFMSRWLLAPFYVALVGVLLVLMFKAGQELWHFVTHAPAATESEIILGTLSLIDLTFTGSLVVLVIFSGYENFVSKIEVDEHADWPDWMRKIDFTGLKLKLLGAIVAISAIQTLKAFMNISKLSDRDLFWYAVIHMVFVVSGVLMAWTDRISGESKGH
jgi:uncharacterized protein (TIGR00645 family)